MGRMTTMKKKKFVKELIATGNITEATQRAYPNATRRSASAIGNKLLKREDIQLQLQEAMAKSGLNIDKIVDNKKKIIAKGMTQLKSQRVSPELVNKSLDDLMNIYMKLGKGNKTQTNININVDATTP